MLVKWSATQSDLAWITTAFHVFIAALRARVYVEWVPSASNPADGLSRAGMEDLWTQQQGWQLTQAVIPDIRSLSLLGLPELLQAFRQRLA